MKYFMLDRVVKFEPGVSAVGLKNITFSDDVLHDHFPDHPMFPGALMIEAMAQLGGFLIEMSLNKPGDVRRAILVQVDSAKFHRPSEPGDTIELTATMGESLPEAVRVNVLAMVGAEKAASARLTFYLRAIDSKKVQEQRLSVYRIWTKNIKDFPEIL